MATTISRQPRAASVRGASYQGYSEPSVRALPGGTERASIQTPYGGGFVDRTLPVAASPYPGSFQDDYMVQQMRQRFGNTAEQIRERENASRDRYNSFLRDQGEDPDMLGNARLVGTARGGDRRMILPTWEEERAVDQAIAEAQAISSRYGATANRLLNNEQYGMAQQFQDARRPYQGPRSSELNRQMWRDIYQNPSPYRQRFGYSANGFGG